ncbi:diacylglycerol acyltransferase [Cucumis melo var. makuwa]|uniref:Diacylglycerol acyltransferase n=1 Tax=Cucumis melo var. makuwa TaxID=1194695 RepID=A0A5A7UAC7_CUCMM|nr:diacylglycerol acyltransferase [Cucumis melo var. makuwa]TYK05115.1 diacylglycerol acyltransferase [Cucumis melo var. makuwa]
MEVFGAVSRQLPGLFRRDFSQSVEVYDADTRRGPCSLSIYGRSVGNETRALGLVSRRRMDSSRFCDDGYLRYYVGPTCQGGNLKKEKEAVKKKLKLLKGLSATDYESSLLFRFDHGSIDEFQSDRFSIEKTREALTRQLQQLKLEEKEQKRKKKLEKAKLKAARTKTIHDSSSSSSESSDNEGHMNTRSYRLKKALSQPFPDQYKTNAIHVSTLPLPLQTQLLNSKTENIGVTRSTSVGRIEVCMGNKCKKAGAAALMEEFERVMGDEAAVCGCKCMGKCRDGPNVRVLGSMEMQNPLCIGVGVEDVDRIVAEYLGQKGGQTQSRLAPAAI